MGIPTLIKTLTADDDASLSFVDGTDSVVLDSTYDEYMFVFTDINPATDATYFSFQVNAAGASGYNETITSTSFYAYHNEDNSATGLAAHSGSDQAQGTAYQHLTYESGNGTDESIAGILYLFSPSSTTYVKHFQSRTNSYYSSNISWEQHNSGYFNVTTAIDEISFKMASGNFDGVIQMYGIS